MKQVHLNEIFEIYYGTNLELNKLVQVTSKDDRRIPFVSRTSKNNGISGFVKKIDKIKPNPSNTLSVAGSGSVLETFYQKEEYYSGRDLYYLMPKHGLNEKELLLYCVFIRANKYRYNYGRQANKTLSNILVPHPNEVKKIAAGIKIPLKPSKQAFSTASYINLNDRKWEFFRYGDVFNILKGYYNKKPEQNTRGTIPFISATGYNNGVTSWHDKQQINSTSKDGKDKNHTINKKLFKGSQSITISNNGSVGYAFYQPIDFTCSHDINPITLKNTKMTPFIAMFLCTLIKLERYRWDYGRKWRPIRMPSSLIKLPVDSDGNPDWQFMEDYIKSLPYSSNLEKNGK